MHVLCTVCRRSWNLACPECAHDKAARHTAETGHAQVRVTGIDTTKGDPPDGPKSYVPAWIGDLLAGCDGW
jgi:hypothetical protein